MYWRINCSEHLLLQLNPSTSAKSSPNIGVNGTPRLTRQRSVTYSTGTDRGDTRRQQNHVDGLNKTTATGEASSSGFGGQSGDVRIVKWSSSPSGYLLAGISRQGIYLWQLYPFLLLSSLVYDPSEELGQMVDVIWQTNSDDDDDDSGTLFVLLSSGYIYEVSVYQRETMVLEYQFATQHYWVRGVGEEEGMRKVGLAQRRTYRLPPGSGTAVCAVATESGAVVATRTNVFRLTWTGTVGSSTAVREINANPLAQIQQITTVETESCVLELYLFSDGAVCVLRRHATKAEDAPTVHVLPMGERVATAMSFSVISGVLAVGADNGDVLLFVVADDGDLQAAACRAFGQGGDGRVAALGWTSDGSAVACAHASGHVVVRSSLGYELNVSRVRKLNGDPVSASMACWGGGGTRLFVFGSGQTPSAAAMAFARAALGTGVGEGTSARVCLFSDDKVLVHDCAFADMRGTGDDVEPGLQWQAAQVPSEYVSGAWPLRHVAVSGDGRHVAVAGKRGLAVLAMASRKWRLLRTQQQEQAVRVTGGLLWLGDYVVAACAVGGLARLMFFSRRRALDADTAHVENLDAAPVALSSHDSLLLVLCADMHVRQYAVFADNNGSLRVSFRRSVDLRGAGLRLRQLRSLQWVPSAAFDRRPAFLVHEGARLRVVDGLGRSGQVLSERAELTITSGVHFGNMHSTVWWFDGSQLCAALISLEDFMDGAGLADARRLVVRPEFFPVAIAADLGMAVGVDQDWTLEDSAVVGLAQLPVRAKLYLHNILDRMLSSGAEHDALLYAACFEHLAFFPHAMEILLHEVLEREAASSSEAGALVLRRVVAMLENFASFHEVVAHCARKTEAAFWAVLFDCVGGPERFFRQCLALDRLDTATQCLIILQTLEPASVSEANVLALLSRAAAAHNRALCIEILRFARMAGESDDTMRRMVARLTAKN
ncbi:WD40 repeat protein [Coemansia sp. RSA 1286]|nr:WD40 repeat protein [Coemansia sp. RSA 1286]